MSAFHRTFSPVFRFTPINRGCPLQPGLVNKAGGAWAWLRGADIILNVYIPYFVIASSTGNRNDKKVLLSIKIPA